MGYAKGELQYAAPFIVEIEVFGETIPVEVSIDLYALIWNRRSGLLRSKHGVTKLSEGAIKIEAKKSIPCMCYGEHKPSEVYADNGNVMCLKCKRHIAADRSKPSFSFYQDGRLTAILRGSESRGNK